jgi:hypothetical protein
MNQEQLLHDVASLPIVAQQEVIDFIAFLKIRYGKIVTESSESLPDIKNEPFIGMWRNHAEMSDTRAWLRDLRVKEWS